MADERETRATASAKPHALYTWVRDLFISVVIAGFIIVFVYQPVRVQGTSMLPGLQDQERIFINKFVYHWGPIERGDIVVFHPPQYLSQSYIKRVIAVGGDRVKIDEGHVFVNGKELTEPYVPLEYEDFRSYPEIVVPPHHYFLLGDHRTSSSDSRDFGPVDQSYIYGKAVFVYWPMDKLGKLQ